MCLIKNHTFNQSFFTFTVRFLSYSASGDGEIRTLDPLLARQVLSQLSYTPTKGTLFVSF